MASRKSKHKDKNKSKHEHESKESTYESCFELRQNKAICEQFKHDPYFEVDLTVPDEYYADIGYGKCLTIPKHKPLYKKKLDELKTDYEKCHDARMAYTRSDCTKDPLDPDDKQHLMRAKKMQISAMTCDRLKTSFLKAEEKLENLRLEEEKL